MTDQEEREQRTTRDLPKSLQAIEIVLRLLDEKDDDLSSIRNISDATGLSMRVVKNALIQLENFNQVKKVLEKNNVLPKWKITKVGKKVLKEASGSEPLSIQDEDLTLIKNIKIIKDLEGLNRKNKAKIESILSKMNIIIVDISKILGPVINLDPPNPAFENLVSLLLKRLKHFKQEISNIPQNPLKTLELKKRGEKPKEYSEETKIKYLAELNFFISLIQNQLDIINFHSNKLSTCLESGNGSNCFDFAYDINSEMRTLKLIIDSLLILNINSHVLTDDSLDNLIKGSIGLSILRDFMEIPHSNEEKLIKLRETIIDLVGKLDKKEIVLESLGMELNNVIPLYGLYQLIVDYSPDLDFTIELLEDAINSLADEGYISGMDILQSDEDHYLKIVKFRVRDISDLENDILTHALKFESFSLADMVLVSGIKKETVSEILTSLTEAGILRYSKSFLHGEQWYIATAWNWNDKKETARINLENFEKELRNFIKKTLNSYYKDEWWKQGIPDYVKNKIEDRMRARQKRDPSTDFELIDFFDFSDYFSIIFYNKNWDRIFSKTFPDKRSLEYPLEKLRLIRNDVAHVHINPEDLEKYPVYIDDIKKFINS